MDQIFEHIFYRIVAKDLENCIRFLTVMVIGNVSFLRRFPSLEMRRIYLQQDSISHNFFSFMVSTHKNSQGIIKRR